MRNRWIGWLAAGFAVLVGVGILAHRRYHLRYEHGPYAHGWRSSTVTVSLPVVAGAPLLLGGIPVVDKMGTPWRLIAVRPTNRPPGLRVMAARAIRVGRIGDGAFSMMTPKEVRSVNHSPLISLPTAPSAHWAEPVLRVRPMHPGQYVVTGLLVTYQWGSRRYTDYAPDEFVVCAYRTATEAKAKGCNAHVPRPPRIWP